MGVVYRAEDLKLKRQVALKFLNEDKLDEPQKKRFLREAQTAASLEHPNVCTIYEVDEVDGRVFLAMALIEGDSLSTRLAQGPLEPKEAIALATQIAEGVGEAHRRGIVHRDIKSGNVMVTPSGRAVVLDFGLAQLAAHNSRITKTGATVGTAAYMSPEQAQGEPLDSRTDVWSLGVLLYEMLAGRLPFRGEYELAVMYNIVNEEAAPLDAAHPDITAELAEAVARALEKSPEDRFADGTEMAAALRRVQSTLSLSDASTRAATPISRPKRPAVKKEPLPGTAALAAGVILAILAVGWTWWSRTGFGPGAVLLPDRIHLAVLPFENIGGDAGDQALSAGLFETLSGKLTELSQLQEGRLSVVPASEIRARRVDSVSKARDLFGVNLAITGSVQPVGEGIRLTANLVDAPNLRQLRSRTLDLRLDDAFELQDGVVHRVIELLELELNVDAERALSAGGTSEPRAYELYLQGIGYLQNFDRAENVASAIESLESAAELDPSYAPAQSGLAEAYWQRFNQTADKEWAQRAVAAAEKAVQLNDRLAVSRTKLGEMYSRTSRPDDAVVQFERALDLDPLSADARAGLAKIYRSRNRNQEAEELLLEALELNPNSWQAHTDLAHHYDLVGRYAEAADLFEKALDITPSSPLTRRNLAAMYVKLNRFAEARTQVQRSIEIQPTAGGYDDLGTIEFFSGRFEQACEAYRQAVDMQPGNYFRWGQYAEALRWTPGRQEEAPEAYAKAIELARERLKVGTGDWAAHRRIALYTAKGGDPAEGLRLFHEIPDEARQSPVMDYYAATLNELAGRRPEAVAALRRAVGRGYPVAEILADPELRDLRESPAGLEVIQDARASGNQQLRSTGN